MKEKKNKENNFLYLLDYYSLLEDQSLEKLKINLLCCLMGINAYKENKNLSEETAYKIKKLLLHEEDIYFLLLVLYLEENNLKSDLEKLSRIDNKKKIPATVKEKIFDWLNKQMRFETFNFLITSQKSELKENDPFFYQNIQNLVNLIIDHTNESYKAKAKYVKKISLPPLSIEQLEILMQDFLTEIDPSKELLELFNYAKQNNKIRYHSSSDEKEWVTITSKNDAYIEAPLYGNIRDFVVLSHEFFHYYTSVNNEYEILAQIPSTLEEFPPIFFEYLATMYLTTKGYTFEELSEIIDFRLSDIGRSYSEVAVALYALTKNISVNAENLLPLFGTKVTTDIINNCIDKANINILLGEDFIITKYKYLIGSYLATEAIHNINLNKINYMIELTRNLPYINLEKMFKKLKINYTNIKFTPKKRIRKK